MKRKMPSAVAAGRQKVEKVMHEFKHGTLNMGRTGKAVPANRPDIAKAIAMSEQRRVMKGKK